MNYPTFLSNPTNNGTQYYADFREFIYCLDIRSNIGYQLTLEMGNRPLPPGDKITSTIVLGRVSYCLKWTRHLIDKVIQNESEYKFMRITERDLISHCAVIDDKETAFIALAQKPVSSMILKSLLVEGHTTTNSLGFQRKARIRKRVEDIKRDDCMGGWNNHLELLMAMKKDIERIPKVPTDPNMNEQQLNELRKRSLKMGIQFSMLQDGPHGIRLGGKDYFSYEGADLYLSSIVAEHNSKVEPGYSVFMDKRMY